MVFSTQLINSRKVPFALSMCHMGLSLSVQLHFVKDRFVVSVAAGKRCTRRRCPFDDLICCCEFGEEAHPLPFPSHRTEAASSEEGTVSPQACSVPKWAECGAAGVLGKRLAFPGNVLVRFGGSGPQNSGSFSAAVTFASWAEEELGRSVAWSETNAAASRPQVYWWSATYCRRIGSTLNVDEIHFCKMEPKVPSDEKVQNDDLSSVESGLLYEEALYTVIHSSGKRDGSHCKDGNDLLQYLLNVFQVGEEENKAILKQIQELKPPSTFLKLIVKEASGIIGKDATGFSDPYCLLGLIVSDDHQEEEAERTDSPKPRRRQKALMKEAIPQDQIQRTDVKRQTLNPIWNETFLLKIKDIHLTELYIEMWDLDDDDPGNLRLAEIHGIHGLKRLFKDVKKVARKLEQDDFLGNVVIKLQDLPYTPEDKWYSLEPCTETYPDRGKCHLHLKLIHQKRDTTLSKQEPVFRIHQGLLQRFVQFEMLKKQAGEVHGEVELSSPASTILSLHATQNDLSPFHQDLAKWLAYSKLYRCVEVSYTCLLQQLTSIEYQWGRAQVTLQQQAQDELAESFTSFLDYGISLTQKYRDVFPISDPKSIEHQQSLLRVLVQICKMKAFHKLCSSVPDLHDRIVDALKCGTIEWYQSQKQLLEPMIKTEEENIKFLVTFVDQLNTDFTNDRKKRLKIFMGTVKVNLFDVTYLQTQKLVAEDLKEQVMSTGGGRTKEVIESLFLLYQKLKQMLHQHIYLSSSESSLPLSNFHTWFSDSLPKWLQMVYNKTVEMVQRAVKKDQLDSMGEKMKHSASAVDIATCFLKIKQTWTQLSWPDPEQAFVIMVKLTEDMCTIALMYCRLIEQRAEELSNQGDQVNRRDSVESAVRSLQLCVVLNNMRHLRETISQLPGDLDWQGLKEDTVNMISEGQIQNTLHTQLERVNSSINNKIQGVIQTLAQKLQAEIKKHLHNMFTASLEIPLDDVIVPLMTFLETEFAYMDTNLVQENFQSLLGFLWTHIIDVITLTSHQSVFSQGLYSRVNCTLQHLLNLFHAEGNGLSLDKLQTASFEALEAHLNLNAASSRQLIQKYFAKKLQQQAATETSKYGAVTVKVFYDSQLKKLHVEILNAVNLMPLDSNGASDPYVEVSLQPKHIFPLVEVRTTQCKFNDLNPLFDEAFEFSDITPEQCWMEGACLLFTVFDHDTLLSDDLEGEAYFPLHDIPGLDITEESPNVTKVPQTRLTLGHPKPKEDDILKLLETRKGDREAQAFIKIRKQREKKSMEI
ncbi:protein unc-13 homolog D [Narcine bancroftii]|uniref:protein unc-13 homolog D n=1 Tax=Narcine bancroftii TaxID=1343680 RepID=UPI003831350D